VGASQEEVYAAGLRAAQEADREHEYARKRSDKAQDAQSRFYALAHSRAEEIEGQPALLRPPQGASLREYQMVGLRWMVSRLMCLCLCGWVGGRCAC
jgi:SWI/SNF-related matrix-associated actin-dependent regulator of chromatin subfamily A protein 2/4